MKSLVWVDFSLIFFSGNAGFGSKSGRHQLLLSVGYKMMQYATVTVGHWRISYLFAGFGNGYSAGVQPDYASRQNIIF